MWSGWKVCDAFNYLLDTLFIRYDLKLCRKIVGIQIGTSYASLADMFLFCFERYFKLSLSDNNEADVIEVFNCLPQDI